MTKLSNNKGFTLIELLVVIAIIGVLSSVVLASLSSARGKGNDAAIKSNLVNMRTQAELLYAPGSGFSNVCDNSSIQNAISEVESLNGGEDVVCTDDTSSWAIASAISSGAFCVDANGAAKSYDDLEDAITGSNCN